MHRPSWHKNESNQPLQDRRRCIEDRQREEPMQDLDWCGVVATKYAVEVSVVAELVWW
jgi:hypothetical protein